MRFLRRMAAAAALLASSAHAALTPDPTGLWMDPAEPGWGLGVAQQGDVIFATLFVYDESRRPTFYFASDIRPDASGLHQGALYRSSGPWFAGDGRAPVSIAPVGNIDLQYFGSFGNGGLRIHYTVGPVEVRKDLKPFSFVTCCGTLQGEYSGTIALNLTPSSACPVPAALAPSTPHLTVDLPSLPNAFPLRLRWNTAANGECSVVAPYVQQGQFGMMSGALACTVAPAKPITITVYEIANQGDAFYGRVTLDDGNCGYTGRIGGVRQ